MAMNRWTIDHSRNPFYMTCLMVLNVTGCARGEAPDEYHESQGRVMKASVAQSDEYLRIATFVRLRDGSIQDPKLFYYQGHYTAVGARRVEKPGRISRMTSKRKAFLFVPVSESIDDYLFLIRKPVANEADEDGAAKQLTEWTGWTLLVVPAEQVKPEKPIAIPPFNELVKRADSRKDLLKKLQSMYDAAKAAAEKRMNTPITKDSEVPWYAR